MLIIFFLGTFCLKYALLNNNKKYIWLISHISNDPQFTRGFFKNKYLQFIWGWWVGETSTFKNSSL